MHIYDKHYDNLKALSNEDKVNKTEVRSFMKTFGGSSLLILSNDWKYFWKVYITNSEDELEEIIYHYCWISPENRVYDVLLGYKGIHLKEYLERINIDKSSVTIFEAKTIEEVVDYN